MPNVERRHVGLLGPSPSFPGRQRAGRPRVVTLTLSPTLDDSFTVPRLRPISKLRCSAARFDPGGGGINVARILHVLGEPATAVFPRAGYLGQELQHLLDLEGIATVAIPVEGETRQSHHVIEVETGLEYRFVLEGPGLAIEDRRRCLRALEDHAGSADYVVLSGSFPPGVPPSFVGDVALVAADAGARLILDTSGAALGCAHGAFLIKPSIHELEALTGRRLEHLDDQVRAARCVLDRCQGKVIVLSRGRQGVVVVTKDAAETIPAHAVEVVNTVGAGDALVAGAVAGLCRGWELSRAIRLGIACSAAMTGTVGTALFAQDDLERFTEEVFPPTLSR